MSTTTQRRESAGFVAETLRRPIQDAVREGVKEGLAEQERSRRMSRGERTDEDDSGGRSWFALLALLGIGVAAFMLLRRRSDRSRSREARRRTESIREQSKTDQAGTGESGVGESTQTGAEMGGAVESTEESVETEDATPGASSE